MIPMTMRAIMAPEPEAEAEERASVILIACLLAMVLNLHRFSCCTVSLMCFVGVWSSLATKSFAWKQSVTATALETKLIRLNRADSYKPWLKSFCFIDTKLKTWTCDPTHSGWVFALWTLWRPWCWRGPRSCSQVRRWRLASSAITYSQKWRKGKPNPLNKNDKERQRKATSNNNKYIIWDWDRRQGLKELV